MTQLDLALAAEVSSRHLSFLETGRAQPSREMVLLLAAMLDVPMRDQNALLESAGHAPAFPEPPLAGGMPPFVEQTLDRMLEHHEPYPMFVMDRLYGVLRVNRGATRLLSTFLREPGALGRSPNLLRAFFDPRLARTFVVDWEKSARVLLGRLHRESLARPSDEALTALLDELLAFEGLPASYRTPDLSSPADPMLTLRLRSDGAELAFIITVTSFSAPQNVTLDELRIESFYPLDEGTRRAYDAQRE